VSSAPQLDATGRPLRDLRISVTDRCNFRCGYCMPGDVYGGKYRFLPRSEILSFEEIERLTRLFVSLGATKLRVTGGEPLIRHQLPKLIERLALIEGVEDLALTTNGYLLSDLAQSLKDAGLRRVTVSLDSHDEEVYKRITGRDFRPDRVLAGIDAAERVGLTPVKINCVVQRGVNDHTIVNLARRFRGTGHILRFIEFMDVGTRNAWDVEHVVTAAEIVARIHAEFPLAPADRNYRGEVAKRYVYQDGSGEVGVIASVTAPFCSDCSRARLSAAGFLITCLFASGGMDLKTPLRRGASDDELLGIIRDVWVLRNDRYSEERTAITPEHSTTSPLGSGAHRRGGDASGRLDQADGDPGHRDEAPLVDLVHPVDLVEEVEGRRQVVDQRYAARVEGPPVGGRLLAEDIRCEDEGAVELLGLKGFRDAGLEGGVAAGEEPAGLRLAARGQLAVSLDELAGGVLEVDLEHDAFEIFGVRVEKGVAARGADHVPGVQQEHQTVRALRGR
jgi:cyclic pyranopterin phosphate synthase